MSEPEAVEETSAEPTADPSSAELENSAELELSKRLKLTLVLGLATLATSTATFNHVGAFSWKAFAALQFFVATAVLMPLWISLLLRHESARLLFLIVSRLLGFLLALGIAQSWEGPSKKSLVLGLLACYFVVLVLESWLLIRGLNQQSPHPPSNT